jgi:flagellar M-ring protein FliF
MATLFRPIIDLWQRLTLGQRAGLVLALGVVIAIAAGAVTYTTRPVYTPLYSGLSGKDASQILDKLREKKVQFEVTSDGGTIKVPQDKVSELRLDFAGLGLPRSGEIGYELFDKPMLGMTDFVQQMNYHRALEGELARTISSLEGVETARIHLVVPNQRLFKEDQKEPTASVVIGLRPGATLSAQQVQSIAYMTAYSVEGLSVDNITIADTRGNLLSGKSARNDMAGLSATQLDVQRTVETDLERKALALLDNTLGPNRSQVKVTAKLNWNRSEKTIDNYDADHAATLSEERQESTGQANAQGTGGSTSERSVTNYQVPHTVEKLVPEVGNIEKISASVLVDGEWKMVKSADGKEKKTYIERTPQELEKFKALVSGAIGIDKKRNDELTVISFPMAQEEVLPGKEAKPLWPQLLPKVLLGVALVLLFLLLKGLINRMSKSVPGTQTSGGMPALTPAQQQYMLSQGQSGAAMTPAQLAASASAAAADLRSSVTTEGGGTQLIFKQSPQTVTFEDTGPSVETLKHQELLKRTTDYIVQKPDNATQILRSWILDESAEKFGR